MPDLPIGTVTFLFTDVEGSTKLLAEHGDAYVTLLKEHRRVLRDSFDRHNGVEVDTQGDAFFVAFQRASDAVAAAERAQRELELPVRIGIHTGEPQLTEEGYVGIDVHRAARICSAAHGGQVVLSQRSLIEGPAVKDLGLHRLKDLQDPERLYQLGEQRFPPLRSLNATNLPVQPNPLVGRERELEQVQALIRDASRLVTLTGPGGTGKTRLALHAAAELVDDFRDGLFWVPLAAVADPVLVLPTIEQTLGAKVLLAEHVDEKQMLLVLDNLEHLIACAPALSELLERCPNLQLLVTSRALLRIAAEREYPVEPLPDDDAVSLFRERATVAEPRDAVNEICRRLDGLPLAVELAAARTRLLPPDQLLERLDRALPGLTGGRRDAPERQRTLRAAIGWSYDLLDADERQLFRRLSVFAGSFTFGAAEEICAADLELLESLMEQSLLRRWASGRLGMLETIREYALEQLDESEEEDEIRRRHAGFFSSLAEQAEPELTGGQQELWEDCLEAELNNLRAALSWLEGAGPSASLNLAAALWRFWETRGHFAEGEARLRRAVTRNPDAAASLRAKAFHGLCVLVRAQGRFDEAREFGQRSVALLREADDRSGLARALNDLAVPAYAAGDFERANLFLDEAVSHARDAGDAWALATSTMRLGTLRQHEGDYEASRLLYEESLELLRGLADRHGEARSLFGLAQAALEQRRLEDAEPLLERSLRLAHAVGDRYIEMWCLEGAAALAASRGEPERAAQLVGAAERLRLELGATLAPSIRRDLNEPTVAAVHEALGDKADHFVAEGHEMSIEQAVEYVLGYDRAPDRHGHLPLHRR
jgi:predicted ATPase